MQNCKRLFAVSCSKVKPQNNRIIISPQYFKLNRKNNESAQEWMGRPRTKAAECQYNDYDRLLTEQLISRLEGDGMIDEIHKEVATLEGIEDANDKDVLLQEQGVEVQRAPKSAISDIKETKDFDVIGENMQKQGHAVLKVHKKQDK